jgi:hypothetical protein
MEVCPKGYAAPLCMTQQRPQEVVARILERNIVPRPTQAIAAMPTVDQFLFSAPR